MSFLSWHYTFGLRLFFDSYLFFLRSLEHYFSLALLLRGLFAPWKRLTIEEEVGFNPAKIFEKLTFNLISRGLGAASRSLLLIIGILAIVFYIFAGILIFLIFLIFPFLSLPVFWRVKLGREEFISGLTRQIREDPQKSLEIAFDNPTGEFVLKHCQLTLSDLPSQVDKLPDKVESFSMLLENILGSSKLREDLVWAARWWDQNTIREKIRAYGRPGIGLELLFGYTPALDRYVTDLSLPQSFSHHLIGREQVVSRIERTLESNKSVFLVGQPGVGRRTVALEFAHRAAKGLLGPKMSYFRVLEFDHNFLLSESSDLNLKKTKLAQLLSEATNAGNVILVIRDLHRLANLQVEGYDFTDVFETYLEKGLKIIAISASSDYEKYLTPNLRLGKFLTPVEVEAPEKDEAMMILMQAASEIEQRQKIIITIPSLRRILEGSDRYITQAPFPEKALDLLDEAVTLVARIKGGILTIEEVNAVLAEKTGVSFAQMNETTKESLSNLEEICHRRLVDQEIAVSLIAKALRSRLMGLRSDKKPVGSFLFLGPTGVGKTETAKALSQVYFGGQENIIRFDMAEFAGKEGLARLIGSQEQNQPGLLTTAVKNRPSSLLLLDEIEKAPLEVRNLLLALLDEGWITDAFGRKVNASNLFLIATSNAGAEYVREKVANGLSGDALQKDVLDFIQKKEFFSPEFLNRFDGVVVFEPLRQEDLAKIAGLILEELKKTLSQKGIEFEIQDELCQKIAQEGYDPALGARPMKRIVDLTLGDLLGKAMLKEEIKVGDRIRIIPGETKGEYLVRKV